VISRTVVETAADGCQMRIVKSQSWHAVHTSKAR
jgi:hypothetical protein